jgi:TonB-dependent Receptor Plug Domain
LPLGDLLLQVGSVEERVSVTAEAAVVQTASAERSAVITTPQIQGLFARGRNALSVVALVPGVTETGGAFSLGYNMLGARSVSNNLTLDGISIMESGNEAGVNLTVSMDAIAEVKVLTSNYQAEFGRKGAGNIQMVSRSGGREFHGLVSYYKRHEQFNANTWNNNRLGVPKPQDRFNLWSYWLSGPVYIPKVFNRDRQKLFFFWAQEFRPQRGSSLYQSTVPTALERIGDFSQSVGQNNRPITVIDPTTRQPFSGNRIPTDRIDPNGKALMNIFPLPNFDRNVSRGAYNFVDQLPSSSPSRYDTLKLDYVIRSNDLLTATFSDNQSNSSVPNPLGVSANWPVLRGGFKSYRYFGSVRYQHIFSPTLINEVTTGFTYGRSTQYTPEEELQKIQRSYVGFAVSQFSPTGNPLNILPNLSFGGVPTPPNLSFEQRFPFDNGRRNLDISDNISKSLGSHSLKAGFYFERSWVIEGAAAQNFSGNLNFGVNANNPLDTGYAFSNAILGVFNSYQEASFRPSPVLITNALEWFVQDNWKVTRRLTLDYGVRFAWLQPWREASNTMVGFSPERFDRSRQVQLIAPAISDGVRVGVSPVNGQIYPAALIGAIAPGSGDPENGIVWAATDPDYPRQLVDDRGVQIGPRVGFAYDIFGNGRTAVRGGFGIGYDRLGTGMFTLSSVAAQYPLIQTPNVFYGTLSTFLRSSGFVFPSNVVGLDRQGKNPSTMTFSLGVQQDLGHGVILDMAYAGSLGRHLYWQRNIASIPFGANFDPRNADPSNSAVPLPPNFLRSYPGYGNVLYREPAASSNYHSLQVSANRRFTSGLQFGANWTWSKAMDFTDGVSDVSTLVSPRVWNYGLAGFDRTHVVKINWLWDVPSRRIRWPIAKAVLDGWQINGIASFISGEPLGINATTTTGVDITGSPTDGYRPVVTGNPVLPKSERTVDRFFDTSVFGLPAIGTFGNAAKTVIRGPGTNNWDLAFLKNFRIREGVQIQFRIEMYNAFNHTQFNAVDTTARFDPLGNQVNAQFGQLTNTAAQRTMQLGLKFMF